jgi:hypothetical protein
MPYSDGVRYTSDNLDVTILGVNMPLYGHRNPDVIDIMAITGGVLRVLHSDSIM